MNLNSHQLGARFSNRVRRLGIVGIIGCVVSSAILFWGFNRPIHVVFTSTPATLEDIEIAFWCMIVGGPLLLIGVSSLIAAVIFWLAEALVTWQKTVRDVENRHKNAARKA
jgi:Na+-driven multidrug efflux pump